MAKNAFKILRCEHRKNLKVCLEIFKRHEWKDDVACVEFCATSRRVLRILSNIYDGAFKYLTIFRKKLYQRR